MEPFKELLLVIFPVIVGVSINDINTLVDKTMASNIAVGAISSLSYSYSLTMFIEGVFIQTITTIYYPKITKLILDVENNKFRNLIDEALISIMYFLLPITGYCCISSKNIVEILFGRGNFDIEAIKLTSYAFLGYCIGFIAVGFRELFSRIFYASKNTKIPTINAAIGGVLNVLLNIGFSKYFGIFGLALATSISALITVILLYYSLYKRKIYALSRVIVIQLLKMCFSTAFMVIIVKVLRNKLAINPKIISFILEIIIGAIVYIICTYFLKIKIIKELVINIKKKVIKKEYE